MNRPVIHYFIMPNTRAERLFWVLEVGKALHAATDSHRSWGCPMMLPHMLRRKVAFLELLHLLGRWVSKVQIMGLLQSPVLELDGRVHSETGPIVLTLLSSKSVSGLEQHPSFQSIYWSHFSEGTMMLHLQPARVLGIYADVIRKRLSAVEAKGATALNDLFRSKWADHNIQIQLDAVENFLENNDYFTGTKDIGLGDVSRFPVRH